MRDILETPDGELAIIGGDIAWTLEPDGQHIRDLLLARKGDYKAAPTVGVGIEDYLHDERVTELSREVRVELARDGARINKLTINQGKINVDANYSSGT